MIFIFFIYGLAFFVAGLAIALIPKKRSAFEFVRELWLVAGFAILHGINEWIDMFILIGSPFAIRALQMVRVVILPASFLFLVQFGATMIIATKKKYSALKALSVVLPIAWVAIFSMSTQHSLAGDIWGRYLLAFPGIFLTSCAFALQSSKFGTMKLKEVSRELRLAAGSFFLYGFFAALIVPDGGFFPASALNYTRFSGLVGIPVQVFRTLCAIVMAYSMMRMLSLFDYETQEAIKQTAYRDALTGIPNRMLFNDRISTMLSWTGSHQPKFVVMMLDLDRFKNINDTLGHSAGDQLLRFVGERLTGLLRKSDTVARMGGDEFMMLIPELTRIEEVRMLAQRILEAVRKPFRWEGPEINVTTSIGIAFYPDDGKKAEELVKNADAALYRAKDLGRNTFQCFTPSLCER